MDGSFGARSDRWLARAAHWPAANLGSAHVCQACAKTHACVDASCMHAFPSVGGGGGGGKRNFDSELVKRRETTAREREVFFAP